MSLANILPLAPEYRHSDTKTQTLYSMHPDDNSNFRLKKISDMEKELEQQANHYRQVAKKYKKAQKVLTTLLLHWQGLRHFYPRLRLAQP